MSIRTQTTLVLCSLIAVGFTVRVFNISNNPPGFFGDEASKGYNAYALLKTGRDEYGQPFPLFLRSFGDYKNPVFIYSLIPFVGLFGLREFSVRLAAAVYGTLAIPLVFLVANTLFDRRVGLWAALVLAILPWHIHFSRTGFQIITFPTLFLLSWWLFLKGRKDSRFLSVSFFFWGITLYTYHVARLIVPLFFLSLLLTRRPRSKQLLVGVAIFSLSALPLLVHLLSGEGLSRWKAVSLLSQGLSIGELLRTVMSQYLSYFSPAFLFLKGEQSAILRHSLRGFGLAYAWQAPFVMWAVVRTIRSKSAVFVSLLVLLLLYPMSGAFTRDSPVAGRAIIGSVLVSLLSAFGIEEVRTGMVLSGKRLLFSASLFTIAMGFFLTYLVRYHREYPLYAAGYWGWQYGARDVMDFFIKEAPHYDDLFLSPAFNGPEIFLKFYDPDNRCAGKCAILSWQRYDPSRRQLFTLTPEQLRQLPQSTRFEVLQTIVYPDGKPAFLVGTMNNPAGSVATP